MDSEPTGTTSPPGQSPGALIAAAREARALGPADLALRLRLDTKIIKALERDDFSNLPEPMFVKGYIRSIAKELGIESTPLLDAYAAHASLDPPSLADFSSRPPDQVGINSTVIKAVSYGLGVVLLSLIILWWRGNYLQGGSATSEAGFIDDSSLDDAHTPLPYRYEVVTHDDESWRAAAVSKDDLEALPPAVELDPVDDNESSAEIGVADTTKKLVISTSSEAWVEVYDSGDARLYFGMARAGQDVILEGHAYYRLILGNTDSIEISVNEAALDLAPYSKEGVAQLELGQKQTIQETRP